MIIPQIVEKGRPGAVMSCPWREIRIQVDVPLMDASFHHHILVPSHSHPRRNTADTRLSAIPHSCNIFHRGVDANTSITSVIRRTAYFSSVDHSRLLPLGHETRLQSQIISDAVRR